MTVYAIAQLTITDRAAFSAFAASEDDRRISVDRKAGSCGPVLLVEGW